MLYIVIGVFGVGISIGIDIHRFPIASTISTLLSFFGALVMGLGQYIMVLRD